MHLALLLALSCAADSLTAPAPTPAPATAVSPAPQPPPPPPPAPLPTPLVQDSKSSRFFGIGFRALGEGQQIRLRFANAGSSAFGIDLTWDGAYSAEESETATESIDNSWYSSTGIRTNRRSSNSESERIRIVASLPFEWTSAERGQLSLVHSVGPMLEWIRTTGQSDLPGQSSTYFSTFEDTYFLLGGRFSTGMRWEFVPGLSLASDFGFDAFLMSNSTKETTEQGATHVLEDVRSTDRTGYGTKSWFGGFGLDAWF